MSTALELLEQQLAAHAAEMKSALQAQGDFIKAQRDGSFVFPNEQAPRDHFDAAIIAYIHRYQFFPTAYRRGEVSPATCWAGGANEHTLRPGAVPSPQSENCATCPKNQYGSSATGKGKACQNQIILAVMPLSEDIAELSLVKASPTALKAVSTHLFQITQKYGHPIKAITRFSVDISKDYPKLQLSLVGPNPDYANHAAGLQLASDTLMSQVGAPIAEQTAKVQLLPANIGRTTRER